MLERRLLGIDLGIASAHTAVVLRADGTEVLRRRCVPTAGSFGELERAALKDAPEGTPLDVVIEPTGPAWLPVAVYFGHRGHGVYRPSSQKAGDLRRLLHRHARSNSIDAETLARLPLVAPGSLYPVELPGADPGLPGPQGPGLRPAHRGVRPQGPAHVEGRTVDAPDPVPSLGGHRQGPGSPARPDLLGPDGGAGATHIKALCVVAAHLGERGWAVMVRGTPYVVCGVDGRPVSKAEAKAIIAEQWTVPEEVRRRRRNKNVGKVPHQVLVGHARSRSKRGYEATFPTGSSVTVGSSSSEEVRPT